MDPVTKSSAGFEYWTKIYSFVNETAKGNGTMPDTETFMVKTYCELNKAAAKAPPYKFIESDLAVSHKYQITENAVRPL